MDNKKQPNIPDINMLAELFLETLKEIKTSGNLVNRKTFAQFLARKQDVKHLLKLAREGRNETIRTDTRQQVAEALNIEHAVDESKISTAMNRLKTAELELDRERDFQKRFALFMLNICHVAQTGSYDELVDQYRQLVMDDADIESREAVFGKFKNAMLKSGLPTAPAPVQEQDAGDENPPERQSMLKRFISDGSEIKLKTLKSGILKSIDQARYMLDESQQDRLAAITERIRSAEEADYLFSTGKQIITLFEEQCGKEREEQERLATFIKDIGKRLIELESEIILNFASSNELLEDNSTFTENLGNQIRNLGRTIDQSQSLDQLKKIISDELASLTAVLDERKREYAERLEKNSREKEKLQDYFQSMVSHVIAQNKQLVEQSQKDSLTGIFNRQTFEEIFERERIRYQRYRDPFCLIMFDIDRFKQVNDTFGHDAGDRVLKGVSRTTTRVLRKTDTFARFGGEEFIIMMPETGLEQGYIVAEKIRKTIQETEFVYENVVVPITISAGVSVITGDDPDFSTIYNRVDSLLYRAKNAGRNTVKSDDDDTT